MNGGIIGKRNNPNNGLFNPGDRPRGGVWGINDVSAGASPPYSMVPAGSTIFDSLSSTSGVTATDCTLGSAMGGITLIKTSTAVTAVKAHKDGLTPYAYTAGNISGVLAFVRPSALGKIKILRLGIGSSTTDFARYVFGPTHGAVTPGWNRLECVLTASAKVGSPNYSALDFWVLQIETRNASDTLASGDVVFMNIYYRAGE